MPDGRDRLEQFLHIVAHDLREPLNTVVQFAELARECGAATPAQADYLDHVLAGGQRLRAMLDGLLRYLVLEAGAPTMDFVDLDAVAAEVRHDLGARIEASQASVVIERLGSVQGHRELLARVLQNLIGNALKFVPPGRLPEVKVSMQADAAEWLLTVQDNGIGIPPERLHELGRPFRRLHAQRRFEGTGLGLAICRRIAEQHGGRLDIASVPGEGSVFRLVLPRT